MYRKIIGFTCCIILFCNVIFAAPLPNISSDGAILIEPNTNTILYSKNMSQTFYPASTTKILTSLAIAQDLPMSQVITKSQAALDNVPSDSSQIGLNVGDQYTIKDGLHAVLMSSDNFVCYDLAIKDAGTIEEFAKKMNGLAISFGANRSNFVNPHGYHDPNHYTTPYALSQIARQAFSNPIVEEIAGTLSYNFDVLNTGKVIPLKHTAALLDPSSPYYNQHVVAAKTGYHTPAGRTLVAKANYDGMDLIAVVMRTEAPHQFEDINKLFAYGAQNFKLQSDSNDTSYIVNSSYSTWAEPYITHALTEGWITNTTHNYTTPVTKREFLTLLRSATPATYNKYVDEMIDYNGASIYIENLPATRGELAKAIYSYLSHFELQPLPGDVLINDISNVSPLEKKAIKYCVNANLLSVQNNTFSPDAPLSYEESLALICKLNGIIKRYDAYKL